MTVLAISEPYRGSRVRVLEFDDGTRRTTSADVVRLLALEPGEYPDTRVVLDQIEEYEPAAARERALRLINYRERSRRELVDKLLADGYSQALADSVADRMVELQFVDDKRYAESVVRSKRSAGWGMRRIERTLADAGVDAETVFDVSVQPEGSEYERALREARRKPAKDARDVQRVAGRLARKGFGFEIAFSAARASMASDDDASDAREPFSST